MSTAPYPASYPFALSDAAVQHLAPVGQAPGLQSRRRASANQAHAIEKLGDAADHLIYSRMFQTDANAVKAETDAVHILMMLRRSVFEECETVNRGNRQVKQWIAEGLRRNVN